MGSRDIPNTGEIEVVGNVIVRSGVIETPVERVCPTEVIHGLRKRVVGQNREAADEVPLHSQLKRIVVGIVAGKYGVCDRGEILKYTSRLRVGHGRCSGYVDRSEERRVGKECRSRWSP